MTAETSAIAPARGLLQLRLSWPYRVGILAYCALIFFLSSRPIIRVEPMFDFPGIDKLAHCAEYGLLAVYMAVGLWRNNPGVALRVLWWVPFLFATLYGASDEIHQYFVPMRSCSLIDWIADAAGAALALWLFRRWLRGKG